MTAKTLCPKTLRGVWHARAQLEVFYELNSATIAANIRAADAFAASGLAGSGLLLASLAEERASHTPQEAVFRQAPKNPGGPLGYY